MVKLSPLPIGGYEAELLNLDVLGRVASSEGATEAALATLRQQVEDYIHQLQAWR